VLTIHSIFVAAKDVDFPACDAAIEVHRPQWFYQSLQLERSLSSSNITGGSPTGDPIASNPNPNSHQQTATQPGLDFEAFGVASEFAELMLNIRMLAKTFRTANDCASAREYQEVLTFLTSTMQKVLSLPLPDPDLLLGALGHSLGFGAYESIITSACRHALVIHVFAQSSDQQPSPLLLVLTAQHDLLRSLSSLFNQYPSTRGHTASVRSTNLVLWLLSVGATAPYCPAQHKWFVSRLADTAADLDIHSWDEMKASLQQVIWHEYQDDKQHRDIWEEVLALREEEGLHVPADMIYPSGVGGYDDLGL
jgi:hypothetical protein